MTKATRDGFAYFYKICAKICLDDREFSENTQQKFLSDTSTHWIEYKFAVKFYPLKI